MQEPAIPAANTSEVEWLGRPAAAWRRRLFAVIFESDTTAGRRFDMALIAAILASVAVVMLDSVQSVERRWGHALSGIEWGFTAVFSVEYVARLVCVRRPWRYARSFYGVIDLLSILPTLLAALAPSLALLIDVRILRLLRVFRIFKLSHYAEEYQSLGRALGASRRKITVFLGFVMMVVLVAGTLMYVVEGPANGFTSIPVSIYWAISTMTTVGFGDIAPKTDFGRLIASAMMLVGWGILAVPTGIVTSEMSKLPASMKSALAGEPAPMAAGDEPAETAATAEPSATSGGGDGGARGSTGDGRSCGRCGAGAHAADAAFCRRCGTSLDAAPQRGE